MVLLKLGRNKNKKFGWGILPKDFPSEEYNGKLVVQGHARLWDKLKNIMRIRDKGYDSPILIDGPRRSGKSTIAKTIGYILDPDITIDNYVSGLEEAADKIEKAREGSVLIFDEGSLVANSKEVMKKKNIQLSKIIDVCGVKRLTLIFCMPSFFNISRDIAVNYSRFLLHVYTDDRLGRGRFAYFGQKKKKFLYEVGKKNFGSYSKPKANWTGRFVDFHVPFEEEYMELKKKSLREALNPDFKEGKVMTKSDYKTEFMVDFKKNCPDVTDAVIAKGFNISTRNYYRRKRGVSKRDT